MMLALNCHGTDLMRSSRASEWFVWGVVADT